MDDLSALRLQIEWGADEALEEAPVDRLHGSGLAAPPPPAPLPQGEGEIGASRAPSPAERGRVGEGAPPPPTQPRATTAERASGMAAAAATLEALRTAIAEFDGCALRDTASHLVFAEGDPSADLLLIGEPPGADEDRGGTPFAGLGGAYLDRMLASIGLERSHLMLTPLIPWRPPGDRPPSPTELAICLPFLHRLIALAGPRRIVLFGALPARALLQQTAARRRPRGAWIDTPIPGLPQSIPTLPTFSPAELMRSPKDRRAAWTDLRLLRRTLDADAAT
jgi:uracil-DNA glycosylase